MSIESRKMTQPPRIIPCHDRFFKPLLTTTARKLPCDLTIPPSTRERKRKHRAVSCAGSSEEVFDFLTRPVVSSSLCLKLSLKKAGLQCVFTTFMVLGKLFWRRPSKFWFHEMGSYHLYVAYFCFSSCPHGRCFTVLAQCFTISSWVSSFLAVTSCFYMYVRPIPAEGEPEQPKEGFGFLARQAKLQEPPSYNECVYWDGEESEAYFDSMWRAGKAMGIIAVGVGFIVMCIVMCTCCVAYQLPTFDGLFWTCMFCFAAQCLSFLSWGSDLCDDMECTWAPGSGTNISAAMLWIWAANMVKSFPEALPARGRGHRGAVYEDDDEVSGLSLWSWNWYV